MPRHAPPDYDCPFCRIARLDFDPELLTLPGDLVYQDGTVTAFLGARQWPNNPGNLLVIPNRHYENLYDVPVYDMARVQELAQAAARALKQAYRCDGVSTRQHNEPAGNQDVWHFHMHITPRFHGDNFYEGYTTRGRWMPGEERAVHAARLRKTLAGWNPEQGISPPERER